MGQNYMLISYLINTWNRRMTLKRHLELLTQQTYKDWFEVLVCVDGATDGTQDMLAGMTNTDKYTLQWFDTKNTETSTAARSRNLGIQAAKGEMIIMQDDDCLPHPQMIEKYHQNYNFREVQVGYKSNHQNYLEKELPVPIESGNMEIWWDDWQNQRFGHFQTTSCAMSLEAAKSPNKDGGRGFDERFNGYGHEDIEMGHRLHELGYKLVFNRDAVSWHMNPSLTNQQDQETKQKDIEKTKGILDSITRQPWSIYPGFNDITGMMLPDELKWLYRSAQKMRSVVEIGSWQGRSTHALLSGCPGPVYAIDHWDPDYIGIPGLSCEIIERNLHAFLRNTRMFKNLKIMRMSSLDAGQLFVPVSVDMVFIDGDHAYGSVMQDIKAWLPKTAKRICGHDYEMTHHPGVVQAVNEIFGRVRTEHTIWYKEL